MTSQIGTLKKRSRTLVLGCLFFLIFLGGCANTSPNQHALSLQDKEEGIFFGVMQEALPGYSMLTGGVEVLHGFHTMAGVEVLDVQRNTLAIALPEHCWFPLHQATVVIAVDRDQCDVRIEGWRDLYQVDKMVSYTRREPTQSALLASMSYGLEGEGYTIESALNLLRTLHRSHYLTTDDFQAPVLICYDYQAASLIMDGRNIEIVVPQEGTFTFTKGILSRVPLPFPDDFDERLLDAGFLLPDGRRNQALYPHAVSYEPADHVKNASHYADFALDCTKKVRRGVYQTRLYSAADGRESMLMVALYVVILVFWVASVLHRAPQRGVRLATLTAGLLLLFWVLVRMINWQSMEAWYFTRYLWYAYYIFQLSLPLVFLWMAWVIDKPEDITRPPKWFRVLYVINFFWMLLVMTNDLHNLIFVTPEGNWASGNIYSYGGAFYAMVGFWVVPFLVAVFMLFLKSGRSPQKHQMILPLALVFLILSYSAAYVYGLPIATESDLVLVISAISLLFMETALRTGMIPVNTGYSQWFMCTPLQIMLVNSEGQPLLQPSSRLGIDQSMLRKAIALAPRPLKQGDHSNFYAKAVTGGFLVWRDDIRVLNELHHKIKQSVDHLTMTSTILAEERAVREKILRGESKRQLMSRLEGEISGQVMALEQLANLNTTPPDQFIRARMLIKMCYIKRRCNLFFIEEEEKDFLLEDLAVYLDELAELGSHGDVQTQLTRKVQGHCTSSCATLLYSIFYCILDKALQRQWRYLVVALFIEESHLYLKLLLPERVPKDKIPAHLFEETAGFGGTWVCKTLDEGMYGVTIQLPLGGAPHA